MYCDVPIENGTQNMKRCDCIVAQFKIDESGESHDIVVIQGTLGEQETVPSLTKMILKTVVLYVKLNCSEFI